MTHVCAHCGKPVHKPAAEIRRSKKRSGRLFCNPECYRLGVTSPAADRFWPKVNKDGPGGCWLWTGAIGSDGYARFLFNGKVKHAHRVAMILAGHVVPDDMDVDHCVCRIRHCVNPAHLRVATQLQNALENNESPHARNARKTHCTPGNHPFAGDNLVISIVNGRERRVCVACYLRRRPNAKTILGRPVPR